MNKYIYIVIALVLIFVAGIVYKEFGVKEENKPVISGNVKEVTIIIEKEKWSFKPDYFEAEQGDKIILTVINEDDFDHGLAIEAFGVSQRIPANETIITNFVVTQPGDFPFYCSVPCGEGIVNEVKRGHFDQVGKIRVKSFTKIE